MLPRNEITQSQVYGSLPENVEYIIALPISENSVHGALSPKVLEVSEECL
jgi:hypothetical protein